MKKITGIFTGPDGTPLAGAVLDLVLSQDATVMGTGQVAPRAVSLVLEKDGSLPEDTEVWANDELSPAGTYYTATLQEPVTGENIYGPELWPLLGASPIELSDIVPPLRPPTGTLCTYV
jgi:hypothetical protein